jgi:3-methylcrotonyl-CoA carboxylase beta subunit
MGREVMVVCNDATVKGGTYYPVTVKKHLRAQEIAAECRLPCVYLVDSRRREPAEPGRGLSRPGPFRAHLLQPGADECGGYPADRGRHGILHGWRGLCAGHVGCHDYRKRAGDDLPRRSALGAGRDGEVVSAEELGGGDVHTRLSGVADYLAEDDAHALALARRAVGSLGDGGGVAGQVPRYGEDPPRSIPRRSSTSCRPRLDTPYDIREVIATDRGRQLVRRVQAALRRDHRHRLRRGDGLPVGIVANNGVLFSESAQKAAHFVELCSQRKIPLVFLQNITGFMVGRKYENEGIARHGAKMVTAVATTAVPKITMLVGGSFGAGNYGMAGRAYSPRFLWTWPNSRISVMGGAQAAGVLATVKRAAMEKAGRDLERGGGGRLQAAHASTCSRNSRIRSMPRPGSGMTGSSTRANRARCWRCRSRRR